MKIPLILATCLLAPLPLEAASILIDFGTTVTTGSSPAWNNFTDITGTTALVLNDTTGAATGYSLSVSGNVNVLTDNTTSPITNTYSPFTPATVITDSIFQSTARTFTLSGLNPAVAYNLTFFSYVDRDTPRNTTFTITGKPTLTLRPSGVPTSAFDSGGEVGSITNVTPDGSGNIAIVVNNVNANWILNGMEITYIPEPAAALLSAFGLIPLLRRRR